MPVSVAPRSRPEGPISMKFLLPCAGKSTRYPGTRPKWMLTAPGGDLMIRECIKGWEVSLSDLVITILRRHEEEFRITDGLIQAFGKEITVHILEDPTQNQSETVARTVQALELSGNE